MERIRPVSDLRNRFADISREVKENQQAVVLTKNGYADMVVLSYDAYLARNHEEQVLLKLMEAEIQARSTDTRLSHKEVFESLYAELGSLNNEKV